MRTLRGGTSIALLLFLALPYSAARAQFSIEQNELRLNGNRFVVRGIGHSGVAIGETWSETLGREECRLTRDYPLIVGTGANTVRTLRLVPPDSPVFPSLLDTTNLFWIADFPLTAYRGGDLSPQTGDGAARRQRILDDFRAYAAAWAHEDRLLAFVFGSDVDRGYEEHFGGALQDYFTLAAEAAAILRDLNASTNLLTVAVSDTSVIGDFSLRSDDGTQAGLAFWTLNTRHGGTLRPEIEDARRRTVKPLLFGAIEVDAYDRRIQAEAPEAQALSLRSLARQVENSAANALDPTIGGVWAAFADEWWRGSADPAQHGREFEEEPSTFDGAFHPGWTGLFGVVRAGVLGLNRLRARDAYFALAAEWGGAVPQELSMAASPSLPRDGVVGTAGDVASIAPGGLVSFRGSGFSTGLRAARTRDLPYHVGGVSACIARRAVPIMAVEPGEIRGQLPWDFESEDVEAVVFRGGKPSSVGFALVKPAAPGILPRGIFRPGLPCPVDAQNGIPRGSFLEIYGSGLGAVNGETITGAAPAGPALTMETPAARLGATELEVLYSGLVPGTVGVYQTNVHVPTNVSPEELSLFLEQNGVSSNGVPITVAAPDDRPNFTLSLPFPDRLVVQSGGPSRTVLFDVSGEFGFCDIVRFRIDGAPTGVRASIPVGLPGQTVALTVEADAKAPRDESAQLVLRAVAVGADEVSRVVGLTILPSSGDIQLATASGGWRSGAPVASFDFDGYPLFHTTGGGPGRGLSLLAISAEGALGDVRTYDTFADENASEAIAAYLRSLPNGTFVLAAIADEGSHLLDESARSAIRDTLQSTLIDSVDFQWSWTILARKGAERPIAEHAAPDAVVRIDRIVPFPAEPLPEP